MKKLWLKLAAVLLAAALAVAFAGCTPTGGTENSGDTGNNGGVSGEEPGGNPPSPPPEEDKLIIPSGYTRLFIEDNTGVKVKGIGVQFDPHYFSQNVVRNKPGLNEDGWELISERVAKMGINRFRVMVLPEWLEPDNDNDDPNVINWDALTTDSVEMQSLCRLLDLAESLDIDVTFTLWGCTRNSRLAADNYELRPHFLTAGNGATNWSIGAKGELVNEFVENFAAYIQYLVVERGYTCIEEITPGNEPNWSWQIDKNTGDFAAYVDMVKKLNARFIADGLRDKVKFNLIDSDETWLENGLAELGDIADIVNTHTYGFGYTTSNSTVVKWEKQNANLARKSNVEHFVGEFGSNQTDGSTRQRDIDLYERGVFLVRMMLDFFNGGACGMSYWTLFDYYNNKLASYQEMMQLGLWRSVKAEYSTEDYYNDLTEDFQARDQYYAYSLMSKYVKKGADVYPIDMGLDLCAGSAFELGGQWVYAFANQEDTEVKAAIADVKGEYEYLIYREGELPTGGELISPSKTLSVSNKCIAFEIPAHTVVVIHEK